MIFIKLSKLFFSIMFIINSFKIRKIIGRQIIIAEILMLIDANKQIKSRFLEKMSLFSIHKIKVMAIDDSAKNNGLPIVAHCTKTGVLRNIKISNLFCNLLKRKIMIIGKFIICRNLINHIFFSCINAKFA